MKIDIRNIGSELRSPIAKFTINLALLEGMYWFASAIGGYGNYYLQQNGFAASQIGTINGTCSIVGIFASILWGYISDRINSVKKTFFIVMILSIIVNSVIPLIPLHLSYSFFIVIFYWAFTNFLTGVAPTLLDNLSVRSCAILGINFGLIRCTGSIFYTVGNLISEPLIVRFGVGMTYPISRACAIPVLILLAFSFDPKIKGETGVRDLKTHPKKISLRPLFSNYYYSSFMVFAVIFTLATSTEYGFLTYLMAERGIQTEKFALFLAVRAFAEVPSLLIMKRLRSRFKLKYIIIAAVLIYSSYLLGLGLVVRSLGAMLITAVLFGFGNGLIIGSVSTYLYKLAPDELKASAQTVYTAFTSLSAIIANFIGGFIYDAVGGGFYTVIGTVAIIAALIFAVSFIFGRKFPNPGDELN